MRSRSFRSWAATFVAAVALAAPSHATLITYDDRAAFEAAAGLLESEDFNGFQGEADFRNRPLDLGPFTVEGLGLGQLDRNRVDMPPVGYPEFDVDGTTVLNLLVNDTSWVAFEFDAPVMAFGADFAGLNNQGLRTLVDVDGENAEPPFASQNEQVFFGVVSSAPFRMLRLVNRENTGSDGFGVDNLVYELPEPGTALLLIGLAGLLRRARMARRRSS